MLLLCVCGVLGVCGASGSAEEAQRLAIEKHGKFLVNNVAHVIWLHDLSHVSE